mgnify:CR=1 FL=1
MKQYDVKNNEVRQVRYGDERLRGYFVSTEGQVYTTRKIHSRGARGVKYHVKPFDEYHKELSGVVCHGYVRFMLLIDGVKRSFRLSRMILSTFVRSPKAGEEAGHLDDDTSNNALENLAWQTSKQNSAQSVQRKRHAHGMRHGHVKLTESDVIAIRNDGRRQCIIAAEYNIRQCTVLAINRRRLWRHVA